MKKVLKKSLAAVGLLQPVQKVWHRHLRKRARHEIAQLYRQFISAGDLCFDIGANIGEVSQVMLELGARVVAVEPQIECIEKLQKRFAGNTNFMLVPKAMGSEIGTGELLVCSMNVSSTLSSEFVAAVTESGRLPQDEFRWDEKREVAITTMDELIATYGVPVFTKIDVEGFEAEVLKGCSHPLNLLSLEYTPERLQPALSCVDMLERLGELEFNYTVESSWKLDLPSWVSGAELAKLLKSANFRIVVGPGGDLYARFKH